MEEERKVRVAHPWRYQVAKVSLGTDASHKLALMSSRPLPKHIT